MDELREMIVNKSNSNAGDEKSWIYRLDRKIIQTNIDEITIKNIRQIDIYN